MEQRGRGGEQRGRGGRPSAAGEPRRASGRDQPPRPGAGQGDGRSARGAVSRDSRPSRPSRPAQPGREARFDRSDRGARGIALTAVDPTLGLTATVGRLVPGDPALPAAVSAAKTVAGRAGRLPLLAAHARVAALTAVDPTLGVIVTVGRLVPGDLAPAANAAKSVAGRAGRLPLLAAHARVAALNPGGPSAVLAGSASVRIVRASSVKSVNRGVRTVRGMRPIDGARRCARSLLRPLTTTSPARSCPVMCGPSCAPRQSRRRTPWRSIW